MASVPQCLFCGRSLVGYSWDFGEDEGDGYICTATHPETGNDVAWFQYVLVDDEWVLTERK